MITSITYGYSFVVSRVLYNVSASTTRKFDNNKEGIETKIPEEEIVGQIMVPCQAFSSMNEY